MPELSDCVEPQKVVQCKALVLGALGINDIIAGAFSVAFAEIVSRAYYRKAPKPGLGWGLPLFVFSAKLQFVCRRLPQNSPNLSHLIT